MKMLHVAAAILPLLALPACGGGRDRDTSARAPAPASWRSIATEADRERVRTWRDAWTQGLLSVTAPADRAAVAAAGVLLQPDAALPNPTPPAGDYKCRVIKIGAKGPVGMNFIAYPGFDCRIARENDGLSFTKTSGSQRPTGRLYPDDGGRMVFLGTMMLGDETRALDYGRDPERDMVGLFERIGARRWRLVLPFPRWESIVDAIEVTPANAGSN